jgi:hypothetical protein
MLNISTTHPVSWPSPASAQVAAVSAVEAARAVQDGRRSGQSSGDGQTPHGGPRHHKDLSSSETGRVPLLPRPSGSDADRPGRIAARSSESADDITAWREAGQEAQKLEAEKATEAQTRREQLQAVLSEVWKASAAVVDRVLGRDDARRFGRSVDGAEGVDPASGAGPMALKLPAPEPLPWPVMPKEPAFAVPGKATAAEAEAAPTTTPQEVVAYDERGNSSLAPLETGVLVDQRV